MESTFLCQAVRNSESFVGYRDKLHFVCEPGPSANSLIVNLDGNGIISFPLSRGVPVSQIENNMYLSRVEEIRIEKEQYITSHLNQDDNTALSFSNRYTLLRFIADELFPRMIAIPIEERIDAMLDKTKVIKTGKQIVQEGIGNQLTRTTKSFEIGENIVDRLKNDAKRYKPGYLDSALLPPYNPNIPEPETKKPSGFFDVIGNAPFLMFGGKMFWLAESIKDSEMTVKIEGKHFGYVNKPVITKKIDEVYSNQLLQRIKLSAIAELETRISKLEKLMLKDVEYMPLMDYDDFRFRDIGFFRNSDTYYVFQRIPKFARQTTYDEELFTAKEFDNEGYAGEIGVGLKCTAGVIHYTDHGLVAYRGPIKEDAPFQGIIPIFDPVLKQKYGSLRLVCHIAGYPQFPASADGFMQAFAYAMGNFLDSFRADFKDRHYQQEDQARLIDTGTLLNKERAIELGFMLTNIHKIINEGVN